MHLKGPGKTPGDPFGDLWKPLWGFLETPGDPLGSDLRNLPNAFSGLLDFIEGCWKEAGKAQGRRFPGVSRGLPFKGFFISGEGFFL